MSYAIYCADCWCESCAQKIKEERADEIFDKLMSGVVCAEFPRSIITGAKHFPSFESMNDRQKSAAEDAEAGLDDFREEFREAFIKHMDSCQCDSDDWPNTGLPEESVDGPSHCGSHEECEEAEDLGDGCKIGALLGTSLTEHGVAYLNEMIGEKPTHDHQRRVHQFWREQFDSYDLVADPEVPADEKDDRDGSPVELDDASAQKFAEKYDELNGAPEGEHDL
jgi:hypothetical protein